MSDIDVRDRYTKLQHPVEGVNGALPIDGLARNAVTQTAGTYNGDVYGYRILVQGTGNYTLHFKDSGAALTGLPAAGFTAGQTYFEHLQSITVGTGGTAILYI